MAEPKEEQKQEKDFQQNRSKVPDPMPSDYKHIVRVAMIDLPGNKQIRFALTKIKGVGINFADALCIAARIRREQKAGTLSKQEIEKLNEIIKEPLKYGLPNWMLNRKKDYDSGEDKHILTGTLHYVLENDLKRLKKIKSLRGLRHQRGLPVRGQRTRSNFRKTKGKVVGVKKKGIPGKKTGK